MKEHLRRRVIKTLCYVDIFTCALTEKEVHKFLVGPSKASLERIRTVLVIDERINQKDGFYFLGNNDGLVEKRKKRLLHSTQKINKAQKIAHVLAKIPTIELIGVSGSVACYNAEEDDDIDLFIVTSSNSLWTTRFLVTSILWLMGAKRKRGTFYARDKICPNMFLSRDELSFPKSQQSLYLAHEIAHVKVLIDRNRTYDTFLAENRWVTKYLPNAFSDIKSTRVIQKSSITTRITNAMFYFMQKTYMARHRKHERITKSIARFHPYNRGDAVLELLELKIQYYNRHISRKPLAIRYLQPQYTDN